MTVRVLHGDCRQVLATLPAQSVQCVVTSPPYFNLRSYGIGAENGEIGCEASPDAYVDHLVEVFRLVHRVLRDDGLCFINLGDSYAGSAVASAPRVGIVPGEGGKLQGRNRNGLGAVSGYKSKDLLGIPWRVAFALQADGWWLRSAIVWQKPNPLPESVTDRPTSSYEMVFMLAKAERYYYNAAAIAEPSIYPDDDRKARSSAGNKRMPTDMVAGIRPGSATYATRNARNVWTIATTPTRFAHFATMPPELAERCILAGSRPCDTVLDPFAGAGTTLLCADRLQRDAIGIELNPVYATMIRNRITQDCPLFAEVAD